MPPPGESERKKRIFLRIPLKISAAIYVDGAFYRAVRLVNLSNRGLSFLINRSQTIADNFEIRFRLGPFSRLIKVKVKVQHRTALADGIGVGCVFAAISRKDKTRINEYIRNFVNMYFPVGVVNLAAFLCSVDVSWRLLLYYVNLYYSTTGFGKGLPGYSVSDYYGSVLTLYAIFAFGSFIFSTRINLKRGKKNFLLSLSLLAGAFIFILVKNIVYWKAGAWYPGYLFINIFFWVQLLLVFYVGFAIVIGAVFLKKVKLTLGIIKQQFASIHPYI